MDAKLTELLTWLQQTTEGATEFAVEQAPLVAQELLRYAMFIAVLVLVLAGLVEVFSVLAIVHGCSNGICEDDGFPWVVGGALASLVAVPLLIYAACEVVKVLTAPRVYVLEWVMGKIGG